jgi:hypothetical protein
MVKVKKNDGLPPNFDKLPKEMQVIIEEDLYRREHKKMFCYLPGDPRLKSIGPNGVPVDELFVEGEEKRKEKQKEIID